MNRDTEEAMLRAEQAGLSISDDTGGVLAGPVMEKVLADVRAQRFRDDDEDGLLRDYPDGVLGKAKFLGSADDDRTRPQGKRVALAEARRYAGETWRHRVELLWAEACAAGDAAALRKALVRLAAESAAWVEALDRRVDERRIEKAQVRATSWWARVARLVRRMFG